MSIVVLQPGNREKKRFREICVQQPKVESIQRVQIKALSTNEINIWMTLLPTQLKRRPGG